MASSLARPPALRMTCAFAEACELGRVKPRVHAGENGEAARVRHWELRLIAEVLRVSRVLRENLVAYLGDRASPYEFMSSPAERKSGTGGAAERVKVAATVLALAVARAVVLAASVCCLGHAMSVLPGKLSLAETYSPAASASRPSRTVLLVALSG
jgi:hypothetical protein